MTKERTQQDNDITLYTLDELKTIDKRYRGNYTGWHPFNPKEVKAEIRRREGKPDFLQDDTDPNITQWENEQPQPKDESKEDEFIELDVPIKTPLWEDDESKEVKEGLQIESNGNWIADGRVITLENDYSYEIATFERHGECEAAVEAYNETYGKGYNPAAMDKLYKALDRIASVDDSGQKLDGLDAEGFIRIAKTALHNAKS